MLSLHYTYYMALVPSLGEFSAELGKHRAGTSNEKGGPRAQGSKVLQIPRTVLEGVFVPGTRDSASPMVATPHNLKYADGLTLFRRLCYAPDR